MFSPLLSVRLKAAENALRDGRLDEALRLASTPDLREHRRGANVLATLAERFLERARNHFRSDRFTEAMLDLDRAEVGGILQEPIAELRGQIRTVASEVYRRDQSRRERIDSAKRRVERGSLEAGRQLLEQADSNDPAVANMRRDVEDRMSEVVRWVEQAESLIAQGNLGAAVERLRRAAALDGHNQAVAAVEARICEAVYEQVRQALIEGRLSRAADELANLGPLGKNSPARRELTDMLSITRAASSALGVNDVAEARRQMMSLQRLLPKAGWVVQAIEQLGQIDDLRMALHAGPLGEGIRGDRASPKGSIVAPAKPQRGSHPLPAESSPAKWGKSLDDTLAMPVRSSGIGLPERLLLLVDGGGSYLILRGGRATLGRAASENPADVPLLSDVSERHANIERVDEDYFMFSGKEVEVGGHRTSHQLLRDGDRIVLGRKAKMTFRLPSRRSPSAVLDLSDTTKMPHDVRRVVLFHQHATLGDGSHAHIRCRHAGPPLLLIERNGELWVRQRNDGHVDGEARALKLGEPVEVGGANLVLSAWRPQGSGGARV